MLDDSFTEDERMIRDTARCPMRRQLLPRVTKAVPGRKGLTATASTRWVSSPDRHYSTGGILLRQRTPSPMAWWRAESTRRFPVIVR